MSRSLIDRSPDLLRLADEGYDVTVVNGYLVIGDVPYLNENSRVERGTLISVLRLAGDRTAPPTQHAVWFSGNVPCGRMGRPLDFVSESGGNRDLGAGLFAHYSLCCKPVGREFHDYHEMMTAYVAQLRGPAATVDPTATGRGQRRPVASAGPPAFAYVDTASSRVGIDTFSQRLAGGSVGIVGLGGTGSYVLDLLAKTPVNRIHLFDDDEFLQHNAFRAPGASSVADLRRRRSKVEYFAGIYSRMHNGIVPHRVRISPETVGLLDDVEFVFICVDTAASRGIIVPHLEDRDIPFIDVGMGLEVGASGLVGVLRLTMSTPGMRAHVREKGRIPMDGPGTDDPYSTNIQVADLNALNAALAVIRWKRARGFYADYEGEHFSAYTIDGNHMLNEDRSA